MLETKLQAALQDATVRKREREGEQLRIYEEFQKRFPYSAGSAADGGSLNASTGSSGAKLNPRANSPTIASGTRTRIATSELHDRPLTESPHKSASVPSSGTAARLATQNTLHHDPATGTHQQPERNPPVSVPLPHPGTVKKQRPAQAGTQERSQCLDHSHRGDEGRQSRWWRMNSEHFQAAANLPLIPHEEPSKLPPVCAAGGLSGGEHRERDASGRGATGTGSWEGHAVHFAYDSECIDRGSRYTGRLGHWQNEFNEAAGRRGSGIQGTVEQQLAGMCDAFYAASGATRGRGTATVTGVGRQQLLASLASPATVSHRADGFGATDSDRHTVTASEGQMVGDVVRGRDGNAALAVNGHCHRDDGRLLARLSLPEVRGGDIYGLLRWLNAYQLKRLLQARQEDCRKQVEVHRQAQGGVSRRRNSEVDAWYAGGRRELPVYSTGTESTRTELEGAGQNEREMVDANLPLPAEWTGAASGGHKADDGSAVLTCHRGMEGHEHACRREVTRSTGKRLFATNECQLASGITPAVGLYGWQEGVHAQEQTREQRADAAAGAEAGSSNSPPCPSLRFPSSLPLNHDALHRVHTACKSLPLPLHALDALHAHHATRASFPRCLPWQPPLPATVPAAALSPTGSRSAAQPLSMREVRALTLAIAQAVATGDQVGGVTTGVLSRGRLFPRCLS